MLPERVRIEAHKLKTLHPEVIALEDKLVSYFDPGFRGMRTIIVIPGKYYPHHPPQAFVKPYEDLRGSEHIDENGKICYIKDKVWNPAIHNLTFVFSQCKRLIYEIPMRKWNYTPHRIDGKNESKFRFKKIMQKFHSVFDL